jgi:hypothetical protein
LEIEPLIELIFVRHPRQMNTLELRAQIVAAVAEATRVSYLRLDAVDPPTGHDSELSLYEGLVDSQQRLVLATGRKTNSVR